jgi:hypothetical protein
MRGNNETVHVRGIEGDLDLAGVQVSDLGEGLLGEVDGALASVAARALVHDLDDNTVAGAGVAGAAVRWARALHPVATAAHGAVVPERVARRGDHVAHVLVAVARRRCRDKRTHARKSTAN